MEQKELMVTITLDEYRDLIYSKAVSEERNRLLFDDGLKKDAVIEDLKKKIEDLELKIWVRDYNANAGKSAE